MTIQINIKEEDPNRNIVATQTFSFDFIDEVFRLTDYMKVNENGVAGVLKNKVVAMLFYEPSTRTRLSFESAVYKLGGNCITTENAAEFSSASKGESIEDSIAVISNYADIIVLRHFEDDSSKRALKTARVPLINAGSGKTQHPTQALLDIYTIFDNCKTLSNLKVAVVGDLLRGRTCDSLVYLLSKYENNAFYLVSPSNSRIKDSLREHLIENDIEFYEVDNLNDVLPEVDVCYMTRIQKERFDSLEEYNKTKGLYVIDENNVGLMSDSSILMHPLPRVDEISVSVDSDKRAKYFEQARNGLYVRMALLKMLVDK